MKITLEHLRGVPVEGRAPGYCARGLLIYADRYGVNLRHALQHGIDADELLELTHHDPTIVNLVEHARGR